jgi:hypothetical protein
MACNIEPARKALQLQKQDKERWERDAKAAIEKGRRPPRWSPRRSKPMEDYRLTSDQNQRLGAVQKQKQALADVSKEFSAGLAWDMADINTIMKTVTEPKRDNPPP